MTTQVTMKDGKVVLCKTGALLILDQQEARETAQQILALLDADPKPTWTLVTCEDGATYTPWTDGWAVGFRVAHPGSEPEHIYLNPSGGSDDGKPCVFVYNGPEGDPAMDTPYTHFTFGPQDD